MIKNIVFDVGNVLVRWDPLGITKNVFKEYPDHNVLMQQLFKGQTWYDLNLGIISEEQALEQYQKLLGIERQRLNFLVETVRESLVPIEGSFALLEKLHAAAIPLYALTDNTHEIMKYLRKKYDFWPLFNGVVVSAEIGYLKPAEQIYKYLLNTYQLNAKETVFIDDLPKNIEGAKAVSMQGIVFENIEKCIEELLALKIPV